MSTRLLRVPEVAGIIDTTTARAYELIRLGILPAVKMGRQVRVDANALEEWIRNGGSGQPSELREESQRG
ncbi:MAG TPA: helix-turn-helix domain-containing protein [Blastocatellia bacterium]|jgi:excisionase family DNA binding protein